MTIAVHTVKNLSLESLYKSEADYNVAWNLDATVVPLLKSLGKEVCIKLHNTRRGFVRPWSIFYIPGKVFSVKSVLSPKKVNLYDLEQYFPDAEEPKSYRVIEALAQHLLDALAVMNIKPQKLTSPVKIWEEAVMNHLTLPTRGDMPKEAAEMAYKTSGKLWIDAIQIGNYDKVWDYDLVSGFPAIAKDLIDIRHCNWKQSDSYIEEAIYGYVFCEVTIYDTVQVSPIMYEDEKGNLSTPTGTWETYLTKAELEFILKWGIGDWMIYDGWWAVPKYKTSAKPLEQVMNRLLAFKNHDNPIVRMLAKRMSVGYYGKTGEEHEDKFGKFFNPCYFSEISTQCRLQVAEFVYEHKLQSSLLHISVDGVLTDCDVNLG